MKEFKPVILFIVKFFAVYFLMLIGYNKYLASYHSENQQDPFSRKVATWSVTTAKVLGFDARSADDTLQPWTWIYIDGQRTSYINEGCNAISIMIIFAAFVTAFSTGWIITAVYVIAGWVIIQSMNILRIVLLNYIFRYYPQYGKSAHDYLFPVIIYGTIFLLWVIWVRKSVVKKKRQHEQVA